MDKTDHMARYIRLLSTGLLWNAWPTVGLWDEIDRGMSILYYTSIRFHLYLTIRKM